jgi:hypothetical protein
LLGDVQGDVELRLDTAPGVTSTADQEAVLGSGNVNSLGNLIRTLLDKLLNGSNDVVNNLSITLKTNGRLGAIRLGESDHASSATIARATSINDDLTDIST